jgi:4-hydroxybenzoate polyprenyltransferase
MCVWPDKGISPLSRRRVTGVAVIGLLLSALLVFGLATTILLPLALVVLPAPLIFAYAIFKLCDTPKRSSSLFDLQCIGLGIVLDMGGLGYVRHRTLTKEP